MNDSLRYFDTSALAKLVLRGEPESDLALALWRSADRVHTSRLSYPETCSAIVKAQRNGRFPERDLRPALNQFDRYWQYVAVVELTAEIAQQAHELVFRFDLSGADAVHVASAFAAGAEADITFVTWDQRQAAAASDLGLSVTPAPG